jgi:hypothetical protein
VTRRSKWLIGVSGSTPWGTWSPIAEYCLTIAPEIANRCKSWGTNDQDGLDAESSRALANVLQAEIDSGRLERFARIRKADLAALPDQECSLCEGTGVRLPIPHAGAGDLAEGGLRCNGCDGTGSQRAWGSYFLLHPEAD